MKYINTTILFLNIISANIYAISALNVINEYRDPVIIKYNTSETTLLTGDSLLLPNIDDINSLYIKTERPGAIHKNIYNYIIALNDDRLLYPNGLATLTIQDTNNIFEWKIDTAWQHKPMRPLISAPLFTTDVLEAESLQNITAPTLPIRLQDQQFLNQLISDEIDTETLLIQLMNGLLGEDYAFKLKEVCKLIYKKNKSNLCQEQKRLLQLTRKVIKEAYDLNDIATIQEWIDDFKTTITNHYNQLDEYIQNNWAY